MKVEFLEIGQVEDKELKFAVISARKDEKWIYVKHKDRTTWEIPGGHREIGENITETAKRELFEETGAKEFHIKPICDYGVITDEAASYGRLFYAEITELGDLPNMEISHIHFFDKMPEKLTYPQIQPYLFKKVLKEIISDYLGKKAKVVMDRPLGTKHPRHGFVYTLNYGYLPNTVSGDGEEIDAYIIGEFEPLESYEGYVVAVVNRLDDCENKLVVCKQVNKYNKDQIKVLLEFQERFFDSEIIMLKV